MARNISPRSSLSRCRIRSRRRRPPEVSEGSLGGGGPGPAGDREPIRGRVADLPPFDLAAVVHENERRRSADTVALVAFAQLVACHQPREGTGPGTKKLPDGLFVLVAHCQHRNAGPPAPRHELRQGALAGLAPGGPEKEHVPAA